MNMMKRVFFGAMLAGLLVFSSAAIAGVYYFPDPGLPADQIAMEFSLTATPRKVRAVLVDAPEGVVALDTGDLDLTGARLLHLKVGTDTPFVSYSILDPSGPRQDLYAIKFETRGLTPGVVAEMRTDSFQICFDGKAKQLTDGNALILPTVERFNLCYYSLTGGSEAARRMADMDIKCTDLAIGESKEISVDLLNDQSAPFTLILTKVALLESPPQIAAPVIESHQGPFTIFFIDLGIGDETFKITTYGRYADGTSAYRRLEDSEMKRLQSIPDVIALEITPDAQFEERGVAYAYDYFRLDTRTKTFYSVVMDTQLFADPLYLYSVQTTGLADNEIAQVGSYYRSPKTSTDRLTVAGFISEEGQNKGFDDRMPIYFIGSEDVLLELRLFRANVSESYKRYTIETSCGNYEIGESIPAEFRNSLARMEKPIQATLTKIAQLTDSNGIPVPTPTSIPLPP